MELTGLKGVSAWGVYNKLVFSMFFLRRFNLKHNAQLCLIEKLKGCDNLSDYKDVADRLSTTKMEKLFHSQSEVVEHFKAAEENEKYNMILEALTIAEIDDSEVLRLLALHSDENGVPYSKANIKNIPINKIIPLMIETLVACSNIDCDFSLMTEVERDLIKGKRVDIKDDAGEILSSNSDIKTGELLSLAVKKFLARFKL